NKLIYINDELKGEILCESCKRKKIKKLTDKCENEEMARFIYDSKLNKDYYYSNYIRWIPFDEFRDIEYLGKGGYGEVHKATWIGCYYDREDIDVVLKRIYNSFCNKIRDILKEVKIIIIIIIIMTLTLISYLSLLLNKILCKFGLLL